VASSLDEILSPEFGAALRRAREEKRLTIEEAASKLRMNPAFIEHMEKGRFDLLPPEPYRKGFIKSYSQLLEVKLTTPPPTEKRSVISSTISAVPEVTKKVTRDAVDLTKGVVESTVKTTGTVVQKFEEGVKDTFEEITSRDLWEEADEVRKERLGKRKTEDDLPTGFTVRKPEPAKEDTAPTPVLGERRRSYSAPPVIEETVYDDEIVEDDFPPPSHGMSNSTKAIIGLLIVIVGVIGYSFISKKSSSPVTPQPHATITPNEEPKKEPVKEEKVVPPPVETVVDSAGVESAGSSDSLVFTITANDSVWLSVTPDKGFGGYRGKMKKGETRTFIANEKFLVFMGNQKALSMKLNGKSVANLPTVANSSLVVRNVVLTADKAYVKPEGEKVFDSPSTVPSDKTVRSQTPKSTPTTPKKQTPVIKKTIPNVPPVLPHSN
jgi:transcriptional regulator with XRE-family HTH domain